MDPKQPHVGVIGAGIVGVCCALWLQKKGFRVTLIDGNDPGSVTSFGNACTIAEYGCIPVNSPDLITRLPALVFGRNSPLSINPRHALSHLPWMLSFLKHCRPAAVSHTIQSLGSILKHASSGLDPLITESKTQDLLAKTGCLYVYETERSYQSAIQSNQARLEQGNPFTTLDAEGIREREPNLKKPFARGVLFENARIILNPQSFVTRLCKTFQQNQGTLIKQHASHVFQNGQGVSVQICNQNKIRVDKVVVAAGAFSKQISGAGTDKMPLDTERGYHIQYTNLQSLISRPIAWTECGFYATPMNEGLRFAGTVEIAGLSETKNRRRVEFLVRKSREMLALPDKPDSTWLGFRPTFPDALPAIGPSPQSKHIFYAFGHQHLGLTLAGITGKVISELVAGSPLSINIDAFQPDRFGPSAN